MQKRGKIRGMGCAVFLFLPVALFGFVFVALPVGWMLGREQVMANDDPVRIGSMLAMIILTIPHVLCLRPKAIRPDSPYFALPRPAHDEEFLVTLQAPREDSKILVHYESPQESKMMMDWLAPLATLGHIWVGLMVACALVSFTQVTWIRWAIVLLCQLPALFLAPRGWAKLNRRRELDHRLLFDFVQRQLSLVDARQMEENFVWTVPFEKISLEIDDRMGGGELGVRMPGQDRLLHLANWTDKGSYRDVVPLGETLARRMGRPLMLNQKKYEHKGKGYEIVEERTQIC